jgi:hypothetical protein
MAQRLADEAGGEEGGPSSEAKNVGRCNMNTRRGLLRLWLVLSILWLAAVSIHAYSEGYPPPPPGSILVPRPGDLGEVEVWGRAVLIDEQLVAWAFGPPLAVLIIGAALAWVVAGFRR